MERARFFATLHYLRLLKAVGYGEIDRMKKYFAFDLGFTEGWRATK